MPEEMAASPWARHEACALIRLPDQPPDGPVGQRLKGGTTLQKDLAAVTRRATALQVGHQRLAHLVGQRQAARLVGLAGTNAEASIRPIDIVQAQRHDCVGPQAKPCEQQEDGVVAPTARGVAGRRRQQQLDFVRQQARREGGMRPLRWDGGGGLQARPDRAAEDEKPKQGSDRDRRSLAPSALALSGFLADKGRDHRRRERRPIWWGRAKAGRQEAASEAEIALPSPHSDAHDLIEIRGLLRQPEID